MIKRLPKLDATEITRFWSKVNKSGDCWLWTAGTNDTGYGNFWIKCWPYKSHRIAYFIHHGVDPGDKCVCHTCDNPRCMNPAHLFLGTHKDNMADCVKKGRRLDNKGSKHSCSKLTDEDVKEILESNESNKMLAKRYGVNDRTISSLRHGVHWKHLQGTRYGELQIDNKTGVKGVSYHAGTGKWQAQFYTNGKKYYAGVHDTVAQAKQALVTRRREIGAPDA